MSPFVWLVVAAIMAAVEAFTLGFITLWFVIGALCAFVVALIGAGTIAQLLVFLIVSVVCLVLIRPVALKHRNTGASAEPSMVGRRAEVVEEVDNSRMTGRVRTGDNMTWTARSADGTVLPVGLSVTVSSQESVRLFVVPAAPDPADRSASDRAAVPTE